MGFQAMDCRVDIEAVPGTSTRLVTRLVQLSEQVCVNLDTLRHGIPVSFGTR